MLAASVVAAAANAAQPAAPRPSFKLLHQDEDWSPLCDPARRTMWYDAVKCMPLSDSGASWLSLGAEIRERYLHNTNPLWGSGTRDDYGILLQRYVLHGDLHLGPNVRVFGQLYSAFENGSPGKPSPTNEDRLDFHQAFVQLGAPIDDGDSALLRLGRQEINYGSQRLISVDDGLNVRHSFDGGLARFETGGWRVDAIAFHPTRFKTGTFDDDTDSSRSLWGGYAVALSPAWLPIGGSVDFYYLGFQSDSATYDQGTARETRHTIGTRLWGKDRGWDWNWELMYQFGSFGGGDIRAWSVATDTGYTLKDVAWTPRLGLKSDVASGDDNPADKNLGTFNPLFRNVTYFSEIAMLGARNYFNAHPFVTVHPTGRLAVSVDANFFWRLELADGVYSPSGALLRSGAGSNARYVDTELELNASWRIDPNVVLAGIYAHAFPGTFIQQTGPAGDIDFVKITLKAQF